MYPRKLLDIRWRDLAFGTLYLFSPRGVFGEKYQPCFSVRTGFDALLSTLNFPEQSEIIMPGMTIPSMLEIVRAHKIIPIGCDVSPDTLLPSLADLESAVTPKIKAVVITHMFGCRNDLGEIADWAKKHSLFLIEDSAQVFTGFDTFNNSVADVTMVSFGPLKFATALGGAIFSFRDPELEKKWRNLQNSYPVQSRFSYLRTIIKHTSIKVLSIPLIYRIFYQLCTLLSKDIDQVIGSSTRAFKSQDLLDQIRKRPSLPLRKLLARRFRTYNIDRFKECQAIGKLYDKYLPTQYKRIGMECSELTYWLYPILVDDPAVFVRGQRKLGIDAARGGTTSLTPVPNREGVAPSSLEYIAEHLCFFPCYPKFFNSGQGDKFFELKPTHVGVTDKHHVRKWYVNKVSTPTKEEEIVDIVKKTEKHQTVAICGASQSQGGQQFAPLSHLINLREYRGVVSFDPSKKIITVRSGTTWDEVHRIINPAGLAVAAMQSSIDFTVGGSIAANIHGRQIATCTISTTILSLRVLFADGTIKTVSPTESPELFYGVIGGYGLLGLVLEVTLQLIDNEFLEQTMAIMPVEDLPKYFFDLRKSDPDLRLFAARLSIVPTNLLLEASIVTHKKTQTASPIALTDERNVLRDKFFLGFSRNFPKLKSACWRLERGLASQFGKKVLLTTNNAKRPPATPLKFLDRYSHYNVDYVQEYFIPLDKFQTFVTQARAILTRHDANVIGATVRFIAGDSKVLLTYASEDCFSLMFYCNRGRDIESYADASQMVGELIDLAISCGGKFYLAYELHATKAQFNKSYPQAEKFFALKQQYDPNNLFQNSLYNYRDRNNYR